MHGDPNPFNVGITRQNDYRINRRTVMPYNSAGWQLSPGPWINSQHMRAPGLPYLGRPVNLRPAKRKSDKDKIMLAVMVAGVVLYLQYRR